MLTGNNTNTATTGNNSATTGNSSATTGNSSASTGNSTSNASNGSQTLTNTIQLPAITLNIAVPITTTSGSLAGGGQGGSSTAAGGSSSSNQLQGQGQFQMQRSPVYNSPTTTISPLLTNTNDVTSSSASRSNQRSTNLISDEVFNVVESTSSSWNRNTNRMETTTTQQIKIDDKLYDFDAFVESLSEGYGAWVLMPGAKAPSYIDKYTGVKMNLKNPEGEMEEQMMSGYCVWSPDTVDGVSK